jgi:hypothetical protein
MELVGGSYVCKKDIYCILQDAWKRRRKEIFASFLEKKNPRKFPFRTRLQTDDTWSSK